MTKATWTREHPEPPNKTPSDWYWFKYDVEIEVMVVEVWPDRKYWPKGWWGPKVKLPKEKPPKDTK